MLMFQGKTPARKKPEITAIHAEIQTLTHGCVLKTHDRAICKFCFLINLKLGTMKTTPSSQALFTGLRGISLACALCCAAFAQAQTGPDVTLYGLADAGITSTSGLKAGTVTQLASGIMEGSRWGIKGNEDLGGGFKAIFTLEARVELDTGASSN